jgi:peptide/nickel transport system permease protein
VTALPEARGSAPRTRTTGRAGRVLEVLRSGNWQLNTGAIVIGLIVLAAVLAPLISPHPPQEIDLEQVLAAPGSTHFLGTDGIGRDILSRLIYGARISLTVSGLGMLCSITIGIVAGMLAVFGGRVAEVVVLRLIDVQLAFPYILLAIAITSAVQPNVGVLIVLMALAGWAGAARVVRSVALQERGKDYVLAAELVGASRARIARKYVFPSVRPSVLVLAPLQMSAMIVFEATLSFLGMGVRPPTPTWGGMMLEGKVYLSTAWWLTVLPGLAIFVTASALILLGEGLQRKTGQRIDVFSGTVARSEDS